MTNDVERWDGWSRCWGCGCVGIWVCGGGVGSNKNEILLGNTSVMWFCVFGIPSGGNDRRLCVGGGELVEIRERGM